MNYPVFEATTSRLHWVLQESNLPPQNWWLSRLSTWATGSEWCSLFLAVFLNINPQISIKNWTHDLKTSKPSFILLSQWNDKRKESPRVFIKSQYSNPQPPDQLIRYLNLPLTLLFDEPSSKVRLTRGSNPQLYESNSNTLSYLDIRCLNLNFSLCPGRLSWSVCVSIRSLSNPNVSSITAHIRTSSYPTGFQDFLFLTKIRIDKCRRWIFIKNC